MPRSAVAAAAACLVLLLGGCTGSAEGADAVEGQGFVSGDGTVAVLDPAERRAAPELSGHTLEGEPLALSDFAGSVVVVNVWASWCGPCREEAPYLQAVADETGDDGVKFLGINTRDDDDAARAFQRRFEISYPSLVDDDGSLLLGFRDTLPPSAIPSTVVVDREGRVAARILRATTFSELRDVLTEIAEEQP